VLRTIFGVAWTVLVATAMAGEDFVARNWLTDDGLPNNLVRQIARDPRGFLWIGTGSGLARFDGREFKEYPLPMAAAEAKYDIRDLAVLPDGALVMLPESGGVVELRDARFSPHPASAVLGSRIASELFVEPDGTLWIGTASDVIRWHGGESLTFGRPEGLTRRNNRFTFVQDQRHRTWVAGGEFLGYFESGRLVRYPTRVGIGILIASSHSGGLWISTTEQLLRLDDDQLSVVLSGAEWQATERGGVQVLHDDGRGSLWIGTRRQGLYRLAQGKLSSVPLLHNTVSAVLGDAEDNIWVGTNGGGLSRLRAQAFTMLDAGTGFPDDMSTGVCEGADGVMWCANRAGGFIAVRDGKIEHALRNGQSTPYAITVCPDRSGEIWAGASDALYQIRRGATGPQLQLVSREQRDAHVLFGARNGDMWIGYGTDGFGFFRGGRFTPISAAEGYTRRRIKAIAEDPHGAIWVATDDRQVFELAAGKLVLRIAHAQMPGGLIYAMQFDADGQLWIATSRGLVLRRGERLDLFTTAQGLPDDQLTQTLFDNRDRLWLGSRRGIFSLPRRDLLAVADGKLAAVSATVFGRDDGLTGASALNGMQPLAWKAQDGRLWFATFGGVVGFDPATSLPSRPPPQVYLDEVDLNRAPVALEHGKPLRFGAGPQEVEFKFVALNFAAPEKTRLRYQLAGYDLGWIETRGPWQASYARLPPGSYVFRVSAAQADGAWGNDAVHLAVLVTPAWWQTGWFRAAAVLGIAALAALGARVWSHRRLRQRLAAVEHEHALEKERARIARDLHDELGGSLTQIGMLAERIKRHPDAADLKTSLSGLAWRTRRLSGELESIVWTVNPKNDTWDRLALFIEQYARNFCRDSAIRCEVRDAEAVPKQPVAPEVQNDILAVVKEALNNIAKHARARSVAIVFAVEADTLAIRVADDGAGFDPGAPEHAERNGLNNMRTRLSEIGGRLDIRSARGQGTEIVLRQPLASAAAVNSSPTIT
jgi:signal transduction histidine kinase/ligand-binding sensor domain-containing protein